MSPGWREFRLEIGGRFPDAHAMTSTDYEKLGSFYLGRPDGGESAGPLLYDSRDLVTHAVCLGMTGSGKTGLCLALIEEAAMDGVPAILIDPKGDLGNLLLTFPELRTEDFRPWIVEDDARRKGVGPDEWAGQQAKLWRDGLAAWGQDGSRIRALREKVDFAIYTPGSTAGLPVNLLNAYRAPQGKLDDEALDERVQTAVAGLLGLLGIPADNAREGTFLAAILAHEWKAGNDLDLGTIIGKIQNPPFAKIGVLNNEAFYPAKERFAIVVALNAFLASPGFASWNTGEPLDVAAFLHDEAGRPRHAIFSIAHLDDARRMFFVSLLLNEIVAWMRRQSGTTSLRALVYMDEIAGYLPPVANPPSKRPMLTLLKQARAFGVGVVLATQNPMDLDYKALANIGTWFIGRLQTDRDKARVIEGLLGTDSKLTRVDLEKILSSLGNRRFLLNNVHEDAPVVFESRWAMSYLRGPLTRDQIRTLTTVRPPAADTPAAAAAPTVPGTSDRAPSVAPGIKQFFLPSDATLRPRLVGAAKVRFADAKSGVEESRDVVLAADFPTGAGEAGWTEPLDATASEFLTAPPAGSAFAEMPAAAGNVKNYPLWEKAFTRWLADHERLEIFRSPELGLTSKPGESEGEFLARTALVRREARDENVDALRKKFAPKLAALEARAARARAAVEKQKGQARDAQFQTAISVGSTILGALFGRKAVSASTLGRAGTAARGFGRAVREGSDVTLAEESAAAIAAERERIEADFEAESAALLAMPVVTEIERAAIRPTRGGISVVFFGLGWV